MPQTPDMHVNAALRRTGKPEPRRLQQFLSRQDLSWVASKSKQDIEFTGSQCPRLPIAVVECAFARIYAPAVKQQYSRILDTSPAGVGSSQDAAQPRKRRVFFANPQDTGISTSVQSFYNDAVIVPVHDKNERNVAHCANLSAKLEGCGRWQLSLSDNEVDAANFQKPKGQCGAGEVDVVAVADEKGGKPTTRFFIFDHCQNDF